MVWMTSLFSQVAINQKLLHKTLFWSADRAKLASTDHPQLAELPIGRSSTQVSIVHWSASYRLVDLRCISGQHPEAEFIVWSERAENLNDKLLEGNVGQELAYTQWRLKLYENEALSAQGLDENRWELFLNDEANALKQKFNLHQTFLVWEVTFQKQATLWRVG